MNCEELHKLSHQHPIIFYDGVCNFCNAFIQFLVRRDKKHIFRFASLQSKIGQEVIDIVHPEHKEINTVILLHKNKYYTLSAVPLKIARILGFPWYLFLVFQPVPKIIRDGVYGWIARNRYKWFGKKDNCMIPDKKQASLFLA